MACLCADRLVAAKIWNPDWWFEGRCFLCLWETCANRSAANANHSGFLRMGSRNEFSSDVEARVLKVLSMLQICGRIAALDIFVLYS